MKPQTERVFLLLVERGSQGVTPLDLPDEDIWTLRLAARIHELRQAGLKIETKRMRTSGGAKIARYTLVEYQPPLWAAR